MLVGIALFMLVYYCLVPTVKFEVFGWWLVIGDCGDIVGFAFGWFVGFGLVACFRIFWFAALLIVLFLFVVLICVLIVVMSVF